jgi:RNA polymerase sigma-70 factor (ECF subfamily)
MRHAIGFDVPNGERRLAEGERTDEQLLLAYRDRGDRDAFAALVHRFEREIYSYLRRYLGDASLAEDAFQATFFQVHLKCDTFQADRKVRPWLYTIATHQAIDAQRRNRRHRSVSLDRRAESADDEHEVGALLDLLESREADPTRGAEGVELGEWIRDAIASLPAPLRAAITLVYYQGLKYREAAEVLKVPVGTIKSRLHAALIKLNSAWNERAGVT